MVNNEIIAIIPARGGSKRIKNKNIVDFFGKPLIAWTIEAALRSGIFKRVVVSTDDPQIADVATEWGAEVPFLRNRYADDFSPVSLATTDTLIRIKSYYNEDYKIVVQLMPNCPLRTSEDIKKALEFFLDNKADFQISAFQYGWMNPWWAAELNEDFTPKPIFKETLNKRSQDLPKLFCPTGAIWIADSVKLIESSSFYGENHVFFPIDWNNAIDIDDYSDLEMAKAIFNKERPNK